MRCVVCGSAVEGDRALYANAWEASLKQHPCCSSTCSGRFKSDIHWMPAAIPKPLSDTAAADFMEVGKRRIRQGDSPKVVARDLLLSGVPPWMTRRALLGAAQAAASSDKVTRGWNLNGALTFISGGIGVFLHDRKRGLTNVAETLDGGAQVDVWEDHFGLPRSSS